MDKNTTLERRFSLNGTHIANPIAESTCLNINSKGSPTSFQWGGTPISQKNRSNSSISLSRSSYSNHNKTVSSCNGKHSQFRSNVTIDPRVYADVQSKGLASRIVKYHDKGTCLTRSFSVNNLYTKPGQFPLVNLKKSELPQRVIASNISMTRIAPPEKSMFYGNTLPSVLRSNSVVAMHKSDEEISRENRPILHPPPTENEMAPTRSVLDVLKEISRKRINSDHLDVDENTKKYCSREINGATCVFTPTVQQSASKRQREHRNGTMQLVQESQNTTNLPTTEHSPENIAKKRLCSYNNDITSSLSSSQIHTNKRKFYEQTRNSMQGPSWSYFEEDAYRSAKKLQLQQSDVRTEHLSINNSCSYILNSNDKNYHDASLCKSEIAEKVAKLTRHDTSHVDVVVAKDISNKKKKLTLFNKDYNESKEAKEIDRYPENAPFENDNFCEIPFVKPKKTTSTTLTKNPVIERTQKNKLALMLRGLRGELYHSDEDQVDEAKKVEEVKEASEKESKNTEVEIHSNENQTQSNSKTSVETALNTKSTDNNQSSVKPVTTTLSKSSENLISSVNNTHNIAITPIPTSLPKKVEVITSSKTIAPSIEKHNIMQSPLVGIKLTPQNATTTTLTTTKNVKTEISTQNKDALNLSANHIVPLSSTSTSGGFSFNLTQTPTTAGSATSENTTPKTDSPLNVTNFSSSKLNAFTLPNTNSSTVFGQATQLGVQSGKPFTFGSLSASTTNNSAPTPKSSEFASVTKIDFAQIGTPGSAPAGTIKPVEHSIDVSINPTVPIPSSAINSSFSFGIKNTQMQKPSAVATPFTINSSATLPQQTTPKTLNAFTFGSTNSEPATSTVTSGEISFGVASQSTNLYNFGGGGSTSSPFSFGSNLTPKSPQVESTTFTAKPVPFTFGSDSTTNIPANKSGGFSFASSKPIVNKPEETSTNIFGSSNTQQTTGTPAFNFGGTEQSASVAAPSNNNTFGATPLAADNSQNKTFTFGSSQNTITSAKAETSGLSFSFNSVNKANSGGFSFTTKTAADVCQPQSSVPAFTFGSLPSKERNNNESKPFQTQISTGSNIFDNSAMLNKTATTTPFNFTANATNNLPNSQTNTNIFAAAHQQNADAPQHRQFRRATRRLQK